MARYTHDQLVDKLESDGWLMETGQPGIPDVSTLGNVLRTSHTRRSKGEATGAIRHAEDAIELDMIEIEKLWQHLGLPV